MFMISAFGVFSHLDVEDLRDLKINQEFTRIVTNRWNKTTNCNHQCKVEHYLIWLSLRSGAFSLIAKCPLGGCPWVSNLLHRKMEIASRKDARDDIVQGAPDYYEIREICGLTSVG
jgi:hypothetical protein